MMAYERQPVATSPDSEYSLTIEDVAERNEHAGHARSRRAPWLSRRLETQSGEKYLITEAAIAKHIAYIEEVRPTPTGRDASRPVAKSVVPELSPDEPRQVASTSDDLSRQDATHVAAEIVDGTPCQPTSQLCT
jgi:hypothetical protein